MTTHVKYVVLPLLCLFISFAQAQTTETDSINNSKQLQIEKLEASKKAIEAQEKEFLKEEIKTINKRFDKGEITAEEAQNLKKEAAKKRAANIEDRIAIIDNKIAILRRNNSDYKITEDDDTFVLRIGRGNNEDDSFFYMGKKSKDKPRVYDRRTTSDIVFAIGFNNAIIEGQSIDDSPYKIGGSGFVELGYAWKTRIFENTNFFRLKYGFSVQWNKLNIKDNQYFVNNGGDISLEQFPFDVDKAKFRTTNLVFPVHLELGPSKKIERDDYFRYSTHRKFKIGLGGYAGFNIGTLQKIKYRNAQGSDTKDKFKGNYNTSDFVYGLSGYVAFGETALYVKYDLNPIFENQAIEQNNISVGLRFDMD